ncbi:MAG: hypothetical protein R3C24_07695 [Cyanobacteriota/Melainabacteria group bacterium]
MILSIFEPGDIVRLKDPDSIDYDSELERDLDLKGREYSHFLLTIGTKEKLPGSSIYYLLLKNALFFECWQYVVLPLKDRRSAIFIFFFLLSAGDMEFFVRAVNYDDSPKLHR